MSRRISQFLIVASLLVVIGLAAAPTLAQPGDRIYICHFNQSTGYVLIEVPTQALRGHFDAGGNPLHEGDYISQTPSCGVATPSPTGTPSHPEPVPEPITMLLFGAGIAGVGYTVRKLRRKGNDADPPQE